MLWLQSQQGYDYVAEFDPAQGIFRRHSRRTMDSPPPLSSIDGSFSEMADGIFAIYKLGDRLYIRLREDIFELDDHTFVEVCGPRSNRTLRVIHSCQVIFETSYTPPGPGPIPGDPTPFVAEEDFDIGLMISNVSKNPGRKRVFLGKE